jgi:hypothetical protein
VLVAGVRGNGGGASSNQGQCSQSGSAGHGRSPRDGCTTLSPNGGARPSRTLRLFSFFSPFRQKKAGRPCGAC